MESPGAASSNLTFQSKSLEEVELYIRNHETQNCVKFPINKTTKGFRQCLSGIKSFLSQRTTYINGHACRIIGTRHHYCSYGRDFHKNYKQKYKEKFENDMKNDHNQMKKSRLLAQRTKKIDCPANLIVTRYLAFLDFKVDENCSTWKKEEKSKALKCTLHTCTDPLSLNVEERYEVRISAIHSGHHVGEKGRMSQPIDRRLVSYIDRMVNKGITSVGEMRRLANSFVESDLFQNSKIPDPLNTRYYPSSQTIANHIQLALRKKLYSPNDQENLRLIIAKEWKDTDQKFFFRPSDEGSFIFVHQTGDQKRMLNMYGNELTLLDATYKTTKYQLHLFFITVKTNVDYQVGATFILETEKSNDIAFALKIVQEWNPDWDPKHWITDCAMAEITAIEECFKGTNVYICGFHLEQAWDRKITPKETGVQIHQKPDVKAMLRQIAFALTEGEREICLQRLKESSIWRNNSKLQDYIVKQWLCDSMYKRWCICYRKNRILLGTNTNNGTESMNKVFKRSFLSNRGKTLSRTVKILVEDFSPQIYKRYCLENYCSSSMYRSHSADLHPFLHDRPKKMVEGLKNTVQASLLIQPEDILVLPDSLFRVKGTDTHTVDMKSPACTCHSFNRSDYVCKHILAVMKFTGTSLPLVYCSLPWFILDEVIVRSDKSDDTSIINDSAISECKDDPESHGPEDLNVKEISTDLPEPPKVFALSATFNRELLKEISSLTYLLSEKENSSITPQLLEILKSAKASIPAEDGLLVRKRPKLEVKTPCELKARHRKSRWTGRVGKKAERLRPMDFKIKGPEDNSVSKLHDMVEEAKEDDRIQNRLTSSYPNSQPEHQSILSSDYWLSDIDINMALSVIKKQWPAISTQDCLLIQAPNGFVSNSSSQANLYAQVIHDAEHSHWFSCTNAHSSKSMQVGKFVRVFDNLGIRPGKVALKGIASLARTEMSQLEIKYEGVQRQLGGSDCGLFAIANVVEVLSGGNPSKIWYDQTRLRRHLIECLASGSFSQFPRAEKSAAGGRVRIRHQKLNVYCVCRLPYLTGEEMLECDKCHEWYHRRCVTLPAEAFASGVKQLHYICKACQSK